MRCSIPNRELFRHNLLVMLVVNIPQFSPQYNLGMKSFAWLQWERTKRGLLSYTPCYGGYCKSLALYKLYDKVFRLFQGVKIHTSYWWSIWKEIFYFVEKFSTYIPNMLKTCNTYGNPETEKTYKKSISLVLILCEIYVLCYEITKICDTDNLKSHDISDK